MTNGDDGGCISAALNVDGDCAASVSTSGMAKVDTLRLEHGEKALHTFGDFVSSHCRSSCYFGSCSPGCVLSPVVSNNHD